MHDSEEPTYKIGSGADRFKTEEPHKNKKRKREGRRKLERKTRNKDQQSKREKEKVGLRTEK